MSNNESIADYYLRWANFYRGLANEYLYLADDLRGYVRPWDVYSPNDLLPPDAEYTSLPDDY